MDYIYMNGELYHYGVKGMKWGHRKSPVQTIKGASARRTKSKRELTPEEKAARRKKAIKVGAAVAGTVLAAYGTYKLAQYVQDKRSQAAMAKAEAYIQNNMYRTVAKSKFADGTVQFDYQNKAGEEIVTRGARNKAGKAVGRHNAKVIATGQRMYDDATNTRFDRGLAKVVDAGDSVGRTTKRAATAAGNTAKRTAASVGRTATKAKNRVLDVVDPLYEEYEGTPTITVRDMRDANGYGTVRTITETPIYRRKVKRR